ncbi:MAG: 2-C-methyl-D-erythritol 4-phosphate cytidylyltransferase [Ignavibacterium sp.]|nr:MAG: 2-C-methyl-D-erythritol 4-phosphate cytidylyltransferase [Ignavibacterium sp.]
MKTIAIIPAGGKGIRSGSSVPKQYLKFNKKELIVYTLEVFQQNNLIDEIVVSVEENYINLINNLKAEYNLSKITRIVVGGKKRQDSVFEALKSVSNGSQNDLVAVHDAARALLPKEVLTNAINTAMHKGNALVCIKAKDTLAKGKKIIDSFLDRAEVYYVQTPQIFKYSVLMKAMQSAYQKNFIGTDESMLVKEIGEEVNIVEGSIYNFKITSTDDIDLFKKLISTR